MHVEQVVIAPTPKRERGGSLTLGTPNVAAAQSGADVHFPSAGASDQHNPTHTTKGGG